MKKEVRNITKDTKTIINGIRSQASDEYKAKVPILGTPGGDGDDEWIVPNLTDVLAPLTQFPVLANEFISTLYNRIGLVIFKNMSYTNPLKVFKKGQLEYGEVVEEIFVDLVKSYTYSYDGSYTDPTSSDTEENPFKRETPDVKVYFHTLNSQKVFKTTYTEEMLTRAFTSANGVYEMISRIIAALYSTYEVFEWEQTKKLMGDAFANSDIQTVELDVDPSTADGAKALIKKARELSTLWSMPSKDYNAAGVTNTCPRNDQIIIIPASLEATIDVDVLAQAYHLERATLLSQMVIIDKFPDEMNGVQMLVVSRDFFMIYDKLFRTETIWNPAQLYWNLYLFAFQLYSYSKLVNAIAFTFSPLKVNATGDLDSTEKAIVADAFSIDVDTAQSNVTVNEDNNVISATLNYLDSAGPFDMSKGHHFLTIKLTSATADTIKIRVNPTQGMGWQTLDSDGLVVAQVTNKTKSISVETIKNGESAMIDYKLKLKLNPQA